MNNKLLEAADCIQQQINNSGGWYFNISEDNLRVNHELQSMVARLLEINYREAENFKYLLGEKLEKILGKEHPEEGARNEG